MTLLCYGVFGLGSSLSGRAVDVSSPSGWVVGLAVMVVGRCIGMIVTACALLQGEQRKTKRLTNADAVAGLALVPSAIDGSSSVASVLRQGQAPPTLRDILFLSLTQVGAGLGFVPFFFLSQTGDVSFISPLMGSHTLLPVIYGFCVGERVTAAKVMGIIGSFAAVGVLGADSISKPSSSMELLLVQLGLLLTATVMWGSSEIIALRVGRVVRQKHVVVAQLVGNGLVAVAVSVALLVYGLSGQQLTVAPAEGPKLTGLLAGSSTVGLTLLVTAAHALAGVGWLLYVRLGQVGDSSLFAPVVQLYGVVAALLGIGFLSEEVSWGKVVGICVAAASVCLLSADRRKEQHAAEPEDPPAAAASAAAVTAATASLPAPSDERLRWADDAPPPSSAGTVLTQSVSSASHLLRSSSGHGLRRRLDALAPTSPGSVDGVMQGSMLDFQSSPGTAESVGMPAAADAASMAAPLAAVGGHASDVPRVVVPLESHDGASSTAASQVMIMHAPHIPQGPFAAQTAFVAKDKAGVGDAAILDVTESA